MADTKKKRASGPSGKHLHKIRALAGIPEEEWEAQREHAASRGETWSEWARAVLVKARIRQQGQAKKSTE